MMSFRKIPVAKKLKEKWGEYQDFPSKSFCLIVPKNFIGEPFCAVFQKVSGIEKKLWRKGFGIKIFRRKFFVSQCRKLRRGTSVCFTEILV